MTALPAARSFESDVRATLTPGANEKNIDGDFLLETLLCDLHWSMLHIGAFSTLVNACLRSEEEWTLRPWRHILHDNQKIVQLALRYCADIGLSSAISEEISKLYMELAKVKLLTVPLTASSRAYTPAERQQLSQLASKWRLLCQNAGHILARLEPDVRARLSGPYAGDSRTLVRFLTEAASGDTKCVSRWGEITLPTLAQRRLAPRREVHRPCWLITADRKLPAVLDDVSRNGIGILCSAPLVDGQPITVELDDGRILSATVVRQIGERVGLALKTPLANDDPLFAQTKSRGSAGRR